MSKASIITKFARHPFLGFLHLNIQAPAPVCISVQMIVIKLCYREVCYSVYYATSTGLGCHQQINKSYLEMPIKCTSESREGFLIFKSCHLCRHVYAMQRGVDCVLQAVVWLCAVSCGRGSAPCWSISARRATCDGSGGPATVTAELYVVNWWHCGWGVAAFSAVWNQNFNTSAELVRDVVSINNNISNRLHHVVD